MTMHVNEATASIDATPEAIWAVLVDGDRYTAWDSGVTSLEGRIEAGGSIKLVNAVNPGRAFSIAVTDFQPNREMTWEGGMPLKLFWGRRRFSLEPDDDGSTLFRMREEMTGLLSPLMVRMIPDLAPSFEQFANGLKAEVESRATA